MKTMGESVPASHHRIPTAKGQVAQFLWVSGTLSNLERLCLRSFLVQGYEVHLYTYDEVKGVPDGVEVRPGAEILPAKRIFTIPDGFGRGSLSSFADLFRYYLVFKRGGWWFDTDFVSIQPFSAPTDMYICTSFEGEWGTLANPGVLYAPAPGHPFLGRLIEESERLLARPQPIGYGETGPYLCQSMIREQNGEPYLAPWEEFSPYHWGQFSQFVYSGAAGWAQANLRGIKYRLRELRDPHFKAGRIRTATRAAHLFNEKWKQHSLDKNGAFNPFCHYERWKRKFGPLG